MDTMAVKESIRQFLGDKYLDLSESDKNRIEKIQKKYFKSNFALLESYGVSTEKIGTYLFLLTLNSVTLKERFEYLQSLDIKSLYVYSKFPLDYAIIYMSETYLSNIKNHKRKGLKSRTYDNHIRFLQNSTFSNINSIFNRYFLVGV